MRVGRLLPTTLVVTALLGTLAASPAEAGTATRRILAKVNAIRTNYGVRRLDCVAPINDIAQAHSRQMASSNTMFHTSNLYSKLRSRTRVSTWGENVGYAPRWRSVVRMWMNSSAHRHNILNGRFGRCGIGLARTSGRAWLTMIFVG